MEKKLAIIIVTYNSEQHIYDCLKSIFQYNDIGNSLEVIIVDNCSNNFKTMREKLISLYGDKITIVQNDKNGGYGQGNNVGIRISYAPYIMIMNPDVRLVMPVFKKTIEEFEHNKNLAIYGIKQINPHCGTSLSIIPFGNTYINTILSVICNRYDIYCKKYMCFIGACFFLNKQLFEKIGMFDENLFMYGEEEDIHTRIIGAGYDAKYNKHLHFKHMHNTMVMKSAEKNILDSHLYLDKKYGRNPVKTIKRSIKQTNLLMIVNRIRSLKRSYRPIAKNNIELLRKRKQYIIDKYLQ